METRQLIGIGLLGLAAFYGWRFISQRMAYNAQAESQAITVRDLETAYCQKRIKEKTKGFSVLQIGSAIAGGIGGFLIAGPFGATAGAMGLAGVSDAVLPEYSCEVK
jgi:hypothetical protein